MSDCLMAQRGGKYTIGRTISGNNLSIIQPDFTEIWSNSDFSSSCCIAMDKMGDAYVGYYNPADRIRKLSGVDGTEIWSIGFDSIQDIVIDDNGDIYAVNNGNYVYKLSGTDGTKIWSNSGVAFAHDIAVDSAGGVYVEVPNLVGARSGVYKLSSTDGTEIWYHADTNNSYITVDNIGNVYSSGSTGKVLKLSGVDGTVIWTNSDVGYNGSITTDDANNVYVLSSSVKKVRKLSGVDGTEIWHSNTGPNLKSLAVDNNGHLYVGQFYNQYIGGIRKLSSTNGFEISIKDSNGVINIAVENTKYVYVVYNSIVQKLSTNPIYTIIS